MTLNCQNNGAPGNIIIDPYLVLTSQLATAGKGIRGSGLTINGSTPVDRKSVV